MAHLVDGLQNVISGLGGASDKNAYNQYSVRYITQADVDASYRSSGLCRKVHNLVPEEMTRAGRDWQTDDAAISKLEDAERALQVWSKLFKALLWARAYGGAAILLGAADGQTSDMPLDPMRVRLGGLKYLHVLNRHAINVPLLDKFGEPEYYQLRDGTIVDPSRVIPVVGQPRLNPDDGEFWGDPLLMSLWNSLSSSDLAHQTVAALLPELKSDTLSIPRLGDHLSTAEYEALLMKRIRMAGLFQSLFNVKLIDGGDGPDKPGETWATRQINFSGLPEVMTAMIGRVAAETDIPVTRLSGISPGGMQSTGKGEQQDFEKSIGSRQQIMLRPLLDVLDPVLVRSALGSYPAGLYSTFAPLSQLSETELAAIEKSQAETFKIYVDSGAINADALGEAAVNGMIERGQWPGLEAAVEKHGLEADDPETLPAIETRRPGLPAPQRQAADAAPRTLYVRRDVVNRADIAAWARGQGIADLVDDLHVTIAFSRTPVDWIKMGAEGWGNERDGGMRIEPGGPRVVEALGGMAAVLMFASSALTWRNMSMRESGASWDWPDYQPHISLTKTPPIDLAGVEPYRGAIELGPEIFEEVKNDG